MSAGNKLLITAAAEEQAKTGHDVIALPVWEIHNHASALEPVDDVVQRLIARYGPTNEVNEYLAKINGHWMAVPSNSGSQNQPPCGRISLLKDKAGFDVLAACSGKQRVHARCRCVDLGYASEGCRGLRQGGQAVCARPIQRG